MNPLAGHLLLAHPGLGDPNFARSVIFLSAHDEEKGAFGLVLNRLLDRQLPDLMPDEELGPLERCPIYFGGPVATNRLSFAEIVWDASTNSVRIDSNLTMDTARELMLLRPETVRAFVGYSGWSEGQLESEMKSGSWLVQPATPLALTWEVGDLWRRLVREHGPHFTLLADEPEDLSLN